MTQKYRQDVQAVVDELVSAMPGGKAGKAFGVPAYRVGRRIFSYLIGDALGLKLTTARVEELMATDPHIQIFEPDPGLLWPSWAGLDLPDAEAYRTYVDLIQESMDITAR